MKRGTILIAQERERQVTEEGWTPEHDDQHADGSLVWAAICYAMPERVYVKDERAIGIFYRDPWPPSWSERWDKRRCYAGGDHGNVPPDPEKYTREECLDLLIKAGALIAAEIDRLGRKIDAEKSSIIPNPELWHGQFHGGITFDGTIDLPEDLEAELKEAIENGFQPVFWVMDK